MVNELERDIVKALEDFIIKFKDEMSKRNKNASGTTSNSLSIQHVQGGVLLYKNGGAPFSVLEEGRDPGKLPYDFISILEKWSIDKGLQFSSPQERRSFAYLLGRRIERSGIKGSPDLWLTKLLEDFTPIVSDVYYKYVKRQLGIK